jgi:hypothetical protein
MAQTNRNADLADIIASTQKDSQSSSPTVSLYYAGASESNALVQSETISVTTKGPPYYCSPYPGHQIIICGYWTAS